MHARQRVCAVGRDIGNVVCGSEKDIEIREREKDRDRDKGER